MNARALFAVVSLSTVVVVGCTRGPSEGDAAGGPTADGVDASGADASSGIVPRPAGCGQTRCDLAYTHCTETEVDDCDQCNETCRGIGYDLLVQCLETCERICANPTPSLCPGERESCSRSPRNAVCVDGLAWRDLPSPSDATFAMKPPAKAHQGACTAAELTDFYAACGATATPTSCNAFAEAHRSCTTCLVTDATASTWGPHVTSSNGWSWLNTEGCIASVAGNDACATKVYGANVCLSRCQGSAKREACLAIAREDDCKAIVREAEACAAELGVGTSPAYAPCGGFAVGDGTPEAGASVSAYFCGAP